MSNRGIKLWQQAKTLIPGGNQLLSKRSEMFLPGGWPAYYKKAKGCEIWDLDGKRYYDFASLGVGSCVLGYADEDVNAAVKSAVDGGSMATLNCPQEVELAKELIKLHPWSAMARLARSGGEACAVAVRIARAASGKDKVAFCGYHGWHDWYLSSNVSQARNLDGQLLPGLKPRGVPRALKDTALPFHYNSLEELQKLARRYGNQIGVIIMEPVRGKEPAAGFLQGVRKIATEINAVLIFDEVTSGFRVNLGGIHLTYGVFPDMAVFGKALGNGYPIAAIIGRRKIMDAAQESFISSTFWTEGIGFAAALATLKKMKKFKVQKKLIEYGSLIMDAWNDAACSTGIGVQVSGIKPLAHLEFLHPDALAMQTFYTQEMLKKGFLAGSSAFAGYAYTTEIIGKYRQATFEVFKKIGEALQNKKGITAYLKGPVKHAGFKRLT